MEEYKISVEIPVQWRDMDASQHVNNVVYLKWIESARIHFFRELIGGSLVDEESIGPILAWQECKYICPVTFPDTIVVGIRRLEVLKDRIVTEAVVYSKTLQRMVAISKQQTVAYDFKLRVKAPLPLYWIYD
jgi:acyl-CoA thioester hydrolase